jgi:anti-sigma factor RsiW
MLPDRYLRLLTSYVDGEASERQRRHVERLLRKSPKVRTVLHLLKEDSRRIRDLTRLKMGPEFPDKVVATIGQSRLRPMAAPLAARTPSPWLGLAVAASVLGLICVGSYWYFLPRSKGLENAALVQRLPEQGIFGRFGKAALHLPGSDLAAGTTRNTLAKKLDQERAYQVDLAVKDNTATVERLTGALRENGVKVLMSTPTQQNLKLKKGKVRYLLFAENLRPDEVTAILQQLAMNTGATNVSGVQHVVVDALTAEHRRQLANLLGMPADRGLNDPPADLINRRVIAAEPSGQGTSPSEPKTANQAQERLALVLALPEGINSPVNSPELQQFLRSRVGARPGTLQVLLVVHEASA